MASRRTVKFMIANGRAFFGFLNFTASRLGAGLSESRLGIRLGVLASIAQPCWSQAQKHQSVAGRETRCVRISFWCRLQFQQLPLQADSSARSHFGLPF